MIERPYTIQQITAYIRTLFDDDPTLQDVWVEGEVSQPRRPQSGHLYFALKDEHSELSCVMWRSQVERLGFVPEHGDAVLAHGYISVYEVQGRYQLYCDAIQPAGAGDLHRQFELLKARLEAEGLFDPERKRPLPEFPQQIGVVTSPSTAAFQDIQNVLRRRYPIVEVILSPTPVQGKDAPPQIVAALERLNRHTNVDVIVLARGGGSLEDLWCFNDEAVARAVAASRIPVVTGVGHEIDFTLVDFAADQRAPTPSAAAELVTPDGPALRANVRDWEDRLALALNTRIDEGRAALATQRRLLERLSPATQIATTRQRLDDLLERAAVSVRRDLQRWRERVEARQRALDNANPTTLLQRGYALVTRTADGGRVTSIQDAAEGTSVDIAVHDGRLTATVRERHRRTRPITE